MRKFKILYFLMAAMATTLATAQKTVTIQGKVTGDTKGSNNIFYYWSGMPKDSAVIKNGKFKIKLPFTGTFTPMFYTQYEIAGGRSYRPFPLMIDQPGTVKIEMDITKGFYGSKVSGIKTTELFNSFLIQQNEAAIQINDELIRKYGKGWAPQNDPLSEKINVSRDSLNKAVQGKLVSGFALTNKDAKVGVIILNNYGKGVLSVEQLENTLSQLPENMKKTEEGQKLAAYIRGVKNSGIGKKVNNFVLNNEKGKPVSFDQFKGKYVWIDFWATWCGPCKMSFPRMREIYALLKDKNFEILGISTDTKIEPWLKYLETNMNPWPQVWDSKNIMSEFAVTAFPTSFLISPDGVILVKEIGFDPNAKGEIVKKLEEVFGPLKIVFEKPKVEVKEGSKDGVKIIQGTPMMKIK